MLGILHAGLTVHALVYYREDDLMVMNTPPRSGRADKHPAARALETLTLQDGASLADGKDLTSCEIDRLLENSPKVSVDVLFAKLSS